MGTDSIGFKTPEGKIWNSLEMLFVTKTALGNSSGAAWVSDPGPHKH